MRLGEIEARAVSEAAGRRAHLLKGSFLACCELTVPATSCRPRQSALRRSRILKGTSPAGFERLPLI